MKKFYLQGSTASLSNMTLIIKTLCCLESMYVCKCSVCTQMQISPFYHATNKNYIGLKDITLQIQIGKYI